MLLFLPRAPRPVKLDFGGKNHVCTAIELLNGKEKAGKDVVVVGGGLIGCETALWLSQQGKNVTIVEALPEILGGGADMCFANYDMLKDLLVFNKVDVFSSSTVKAVNDASVTVKTPNGEKEIKADTVMVAVGYHSSKDLYDSMKDSKKIVYNTGDSRKVHNIMDAIWVRTNSPENCNRTGEVMNLIFVLEDTALSEGYMNAPPDNYRGQR